MRRKPIFLAFGFLLLAALFPSLSAAQDSRLEGTVIDAQTGEPLAGANVVLQLAQKDAGTIGTATDSRGRFSFDNLMPGTYKLTISYIGYSAIVNDDLEIAAGQVENLTVRMLSTYINVNPISITASRRPEKLLEAPASIHIIEEDQIASRTTLTVADHLKGLPGIDIIQSGLGTPHIAMRGFNNVFAGSLMMLTDNRIARVPSIRINAYTLLPSSNDDIERIEVVSGPGSALYGPNSANGVLHILTKSPFGSEGTVFNIGGGERSLLMSSFRHASKLSNNVGFKLSAQYYQGEDWPFSDPSEPDTLIKGRQTPEGRIATSEPFANTKDFTVQKYSIDGRIDVKFSDETTLIFNSALSQIDENVVTPIGSAAANGWKYVYHQARFRHHNLFIQGFVNRTNSGDTYFYRSGDIILDRSRLLVGQIQHSLSPTPWQRFTYGFDALLTRPDTENTINGRNEDNDNIDEYGVYIQSETQLSTRLKLIAAARLDDHNRLEDNVFSPRAALVYSTPYGQNFRLTYNKAFSTPETNNLFLDILTTQDAFTFGSTLEGVYDFDAGTNFRAQGVPVSGFHFSHSDAGPQFRSPFASLDPRGLSNRDFIDLHDPIFTNVMWQVARGIIISGFGENLREQLGASLPPQIIDALIDDFEATIIPRTVTGVRNKLQEIDLETRDFRPSDGVADIPRLKPTTTQTFEFGYKGLVSRKIFLSFDLYHSRINNFIGPLLIETPNVFLDAQTLRASIADQIAANYNNSQNFLLLGILAQLDDRANGGNGNGTPVDELVTIFADSVAAMPLGTVSPREASDPTAVLLTFRNFGNISLTGADLGMTYFVTPRWILNGSFSYVSRNLFEKSATQPQEIPLNAPRRKYSLAARYNNQQLGLDAEVKGRYVEGFPFKSGELVGMVDSYSIVDVTVGYDVWSRTKVTLSVSNLLDNRHRQVIGAPEIGRLALLRLTQTF